MHQGVTARTRGHGKTDDEDTDAGVRVLPCKVVTIVLAHLSQAEAHDVDVEEQVHPMSRRQSPHHSLRAASERRQPPVSLSDDVWTLTKL